MLIENRSYPSTAIFDTLPAQEAMMKYYPNGLPPDFNHKWNPISEENRKLIGEAPPLTAEEKAEFKSMLGEVNLLYLGCKVLILCDTGYVGRFWTSYECWLAMQDSTLSFWPRS